MHFDRDLGEGKRFGQAILHDADGFAHCGVLTSRHARNPAPRHEMRREESCGRLGVQISRLSVGRQRPDDVFNKRVARAQSRGQRLEIGDALSQPTGSLFDISPSDMHLNG